MEKSNSVVIKNFLLVYKFPPRYFLGANIEEGHGSDDTNSTNDTSNDPLVSVISIEWLTTTGTSTTSFTTGAE